MKHLIKLSMKDLKERVGSKVVIIYNGAIYVWTLLGITDRSNLIFSDFHEIPGSSIVNDSVLIFDYEEARDLLV